MDDLQLFIDNYKLIDEKKEDPNFFQVAGFPHYENVNSNVLCFLMNKTDLVLKLLLECVEKKNDIVLTFHNIEEDAEREVATTKGRMDIVVYTDKYVIGIENKVYAQLYNDISDYCSYLSKEAENDEEKSKSKEFFLIVLSKNDESERIKEFCKNKNYQVYNVLHKEFSEKLSKKYSELLDDLGHRYFFLLTEYVANINFLEKGGFMDNDFIVFAKFGDNLKKIRHIVKKGADLHKCFYDKTQSILTELKEYKKPFESDGIWNDKENFLSIAWFSDYKIEEFIITIDVAVGIHGFIIDIFNRNKKTNSFDEEFGKLLKKILPKLEYVVVDINEKFLPEEEKKYTSSKRALFYEDIDLGNQDKLIEKLKEIFDSFEEYKIKTNNPPN
jgi:hypothetical protein